MNSIYTTTITDEARRRGIRVRVLDPALPVFELARGRQKVRCFNALTDRVGAATFHLAQHKHAAHNFLAAQGFPVPAQLKFAAWPDALRFLRRHRSIVVKPCNQWGGRGVSVAVRTPAELRAAVRRARSFEEDVVLEQCVGGADYRLIFVDYRFVAAILRTPATVTGDGQHTLEQLIRRKNRAAGAADPGHGIPLETETRRNLAAMGWKLTDVPRAGRRVTVRLTTNCHTGGDAEVVTGRVPRPLVRLAARVVRALQLPVAGVDFLVDSKRGRQWIIEVSPDVGISPPEGAEVARRFLDYLFPSGHKRQPRLNTD